MLAKHTNNEDSLVTRILKAKYFAKSNFMEVQLGSNPSYTWKSLLEGRLVFEKRLLWRVGTDTNIMINISTWVPNTPISEYK